MALSATRALLACSASAYSTHMPDAAKVTFTAINKAMMERGSSNGGVISPISPLEAYHHIAKAVGPEHLSEGMPEPTLRSRLISLIGRDLTDETAGTLAARAIDLRDPVAQQAAASSILLRIAHACSSVLATSNVFGIFSLALATDLPFPSTTKTLETEKLRHLYDGLLMKPGSLSEHRNHLLVHFNLDPVYVDLELLTRNARKLAPYGDDAIAGVCLYRATVIGENSAAKLARAFATARVVQLIKAAYTAPAASAPTTVKGPLPSSPPML